MSEPGAARRAATVPTWVSQAAATARRPNFPGRASRRDTPRRGTKPVARSWSPVTSMTSSNSAVQCGRPARPGIRVDLTAAHVDIRRGRPGPGRRSRRTATPPSAARWRGHDASPGWQAGQAHSTGAPPAGTSAVHPRTGGLRAGGAASRSRRPSARRRRRRVEPARRHAVDRLGRGGVQVEQPAVAAAARGGVIMEIPPLRERGAGEIAWRLCTGPASVLGQNGGLGRARSGSGGTAGLGRGVLHWSAAAAGPLPWRGRARGWPW